MSAQTPPRPDQTLRATPDGLSLETPAHYSFAAATAPDGAVWFTEFNRQRLWRHVPATGKTELRRQGLPGMYGVAVDRDGNVFVGQDLGDQGNPGKVVRIDARTRAETVVVDGVTRPRQIACDRSGDVYVVCEAGSRAAGAGAALLRWRRADDTVVPWMTALRTPQGVAVTPEGRVVVSEYGTAGSAPGRVLRRANDGSAVPVATGFWRARGLALAPDGTLALTTEADYEDHGNSGLLVRIDPGSGRVLSRLAGLDYPQFPCAGPDGRLWFACNRDSWLAAFDPKRAATRTRWEKDDVCTVGVSGGTFAPKGPGVRLTITVQDLRFDGRVRAHTPGRPVEGWIRIPARRLRLNPHELYTDRGDPEHPQPGIFELPMVRAHADRGSIRAHAVAVRGHGGQRFPMTDPGTAREAPPPGFTESPVASLVWFRWTETPSRS